MFILGFFLLLLISYGEIFNFRKISNHLEIKNLLTAIFVVGGFIVTCAVIVIQSVMLKNIFLVFMDWRLYLGMALEIFGVWLTRKNYEVNSSSITSINFALFFSIILVPILAFYASGFFGFDGAIKLHYKSEQEMLLFLLCFFVLMILYFYDKLKGHVNNIWLLFLMPISLSSSLFWTTKMMQIYEGVVYYAAIGFSLLMFFTLQALKNNELSRFKKEHKKDALIILGVSSVILPLNILVVKFLAVEFLAIFKRVSQVITALYLDSVENGKRHLNNIKDVIVIVLLLTTAIVMFFRT